MSSSLQNEVDLPFIDMSQFQLEFEQLNNLQHHPAVATVREACKKWGFFRVLNAGIPIHLLQNVERVIHELCGMPPEVKNRAVTSVPSDSYFRSPLLEAFCFLNVPHSDSVQALSRKIWPEKGNPDFCETIGAYTLAMADLQRKISKIILASLGLEVKTFYHSDFEEYTAYMRINHYFSDGKSTEEENALFPHTDTSCYTILFQDDEGGLQIRSDEGKWLNVNPVSNSFVVNVADSLKAWSNGRYRSAEHQVVCKGWTDRISVPWFVHFPYDKQIWAPAELVDDQSDHPRCYRPFTFSQFKRDYRANLISKQENPATFVESYAGISHGKVHGGWETQL